MKKLKLLGAVYEGHTGLIGRYQFVDGVSIEPIPQNERVRIGANFSVIEIEEDGSDGVDPSPAVTVISTRHRVLPVETLARQTEDEKNAENATIVLGSAEHRLLLTQEALEDVASKSGIAGLRAIAEKWNVRSKAIPSLIQLILAAQQEFIKDRRVYLQERGIPEDEIEALLALQDTAPEARVVKIAPAPEPAAVLIADPVVDDGDVAEDGDEFETALQEAAASGDLAAALNAPADQTADQSE